MVGDLISVKIEISYRIRLRQYYLSGDIEGEKIDYVFKRDRRALCFNKSVIKNNNFFNELSKIKSLYIER